MSHNLHLSKLGDSTNQSGDVSLSDAAGGNQTNLNISMKHFQADKVTAGPQFVNIPGATILLSTDNWAYSWYGSGNRGYISVTPNEPSTAGIEIKLYDESFSLLQTKSGCSHNKAYTFSSLDGKKYYYSDYLKYNFKTKKRGD